MNLSICILKTLVYFLMEGPHPTALSVKMTDALASYVSNCKFKRKKQYIFSYLHTSVHIVCFSM